MDAPEPRTPPETLPVSLIDTLTRLRDQELTSEQILLLLDLLYEIRDVRKRHEYVDLRERVRRVLRVMDKARTFSKE